MNPAADPELLGRLLSEQGGALALYAAQWTDAPEDCVQEALLELVRQPALPENVVAWLFRVVRNRAIGRARARDRRRRYEQQAAAQRPSFVESSLEGGLSAGDLRLALEKLDGDLREVVVARIWGGLGFEKIAELTGTSLSTAHRRYAAGLHALREYLEPTCIPEQTTTP